MNVGTVALAVIVLVCVASFAVCAHRLRAVDRDDLDRELVR